jgi:hypothetical protein
VTALTDSVVEFGLIPNDNWVQPSWIDEANATAARADMEKNNVIYGGETSFSCKYIHLLKVVYIIRQRSVCSPNIRSSISLSHFVFVDIGICAASTLA